MQNGGMTTPEAIVRALAAADPRYDTGYDGEIEACALCKATVEDRILAPHDHTPDCPWRLAVEWVAQADAEPTHDTAAAGREQYHALGRRMEEVTVFEPRPWKI